MNSAPRASGGTPGRRAAMPSPRRSSRSRCRRPCRRSCARPNPPKPDVTGGVETAYRRAWRSRMSSSEITPKQLYVRRREFLKLGAGSALALSLPAFAKAKVEHGAKLAGVTANPKYALAEEEKNAYDGITASHNFHGVGTDNSHSSG